MKGNTLDATVYLIPLKDKCIFLAWAVDTLYYTAFLAEQVCSWMGGITFSQKVLFVLA